MYFIAIVMLLVLSVITGLGVFSQKFQDNLIQRLGLVLMCLGSLSSAWRLWEVETISHSAMTLLSGTFVFAIGSTIKSCQKWPTERA